MALVSPAPVLVWVPVKVGDISYSVALGSSVVYLVRG